MSAVFHSESIGYTVYMRKSITLFVFLPLFLAGCVAVTSQPEPSLLSYEELVLQAKHGKLVDIDEISEAFLTEHIDGESLIELAQFEQQISLLEDRKLRLGPVASAILDRCYLSFVGHLAMEDYYENLSNDHSELHSSLLEQIREYIGGERDGTLSSPYRAFTVPQAEAFVAQDGFTVIGSSYESTQEMPWLLRLIVTADGARSKSVFFDLSKVFDTLAVKANVVDVEDYPRKRGGIVSTLAMEGDPTAQASLGISLLQADREGEARRVLDAASQRGNSYADIVLGQIYASRRFTNNERYRESVLNAANRHYTRAIARGHHRGLRELGVLYLGGNFGETQRTYGIELLERGAELQDIGSLIQLARINYMGSVVDQNFDLADDHYRQAAQLGDGSARIEYFRFLSNPETGRSVSDEAHEWLVEEAEGENAWAMYELGTCAAKGCLGKPNYRRAHSWYRRAVETAPNDADIVNGVAWTLAVSDVAQMRKPRYALRIITTLMENHQIARRIPQYIDTWAAAYAARGNFEKAIELQTEALERAQNDERIGPESLQAIQSHLDSFTHGEKVIEPTF